MDYVKLRFLADHSLADALSYELNKLGAEGVSVVDKTELAGVYHDKGELNYALDDYLDGLPDRAEVEGYFRYADSNEANDASSADNPLLRVAEDDYEGLLYEARDYTSLSQLDLLARLAAELESYKQNLGGSYEFIGSEIVKEEDWANNWKSYYEPLALSPRLTVCPSWIDYPDARPEEIVIRIDPGQAFGTGYHESTEISAFFLDQLQKHKPDFTTQARALDLGTGSGILAIFMARLGVPEIEAIDIDPQAVATAKENFSFNGLDWSDQPQAGTLSVYTGELADTRGEFDLIVANLIASLHLDLAAAYREKLRPEGRIILSGIIDERMPAVRKKMAEVGLILEEAHYKRGWWTLLAARKEDLDQQLC
ncbi:MAG: 50S ribosomal protein L11 methyltransferase [Eubacteriales bacterium]|nr:50S ribosomal protein L11 methyltransferase [Eubacteriales bacterium]